jgi:hypothetical protein
MNASNRTILAAVFVAIPSLVLWGAPAASVVLGCLSTAGLLLLRERRRLARSRG